jgi:hypothetical protein
VNLNCFLSIFKETMQEIQTQRRKKSDKAKEKQERFGKFTKKHVREMTKKQNKNNSAN